MITENNKTFILKEIFSRKMFVALIMGFASGLPLLLTTGSLIQAWMRDEGVDLTVIGMTALIGLPYTLKFIWAPFLDRFVPPFLGRRRGWLLIFQVFLIISIAFLGQTDPSENLWMVAFVALLVTFFSASQDIVADAYRREDLLDEELGLGSSMFINGYRVGMLLASGGGLILADRVPFSTVYLIMSAFMTIGVITTLLTPEPELPDELPKTIKEAVIDPFVEYFSRERALLILIFILLYKIGDSMASAITMPFYLDTGFTKTEVGAIVKLFGFWATIVGGMTGGIFMLRFGINKSLWIFGLLQMISTAGFAILAHVGYSLSFLSGVIAFENFSGGMGTSAYVAYMASLTNKKFTATQYALLTCLMGVPRVFVSSGTGYMAKQFGWETFFIFCTLIAIPGMLLLFKIAPWNGRLGK